MALRALWTRGTATLTAILPAGWRFMIIITGKDRWINRLGSRSAIDLF